MLAFAFVLLLVLVAQEFRLFERAWFNVQNSYSSEQQDDSIGLADYQIDIEAKLLGDLEEVSALAYDPDRNTLFTVTNQKAELIELSLDGDILRRISLEGFGDAEAVEYISPGVYVISDERKQRLIKVRVTDNTTHLVADHYQQFSLNIGGGGNKGFEGLAYDPHTKRLFAAKERDPVRIFEINGFPHEKSEQPFNVHVGGNVARDEALFVRDLSSLHFDVRSGHLLALSDESRLLLELNKKGKVISSLSLLGGTNGLKDSIPQAEGVAMDRQGVLYLTSEPNLFYRFKPAAQ
ncbi:SdiA-regulated domain-containing protein [Ectopseudomonas mendocina]|uniref:SdiA-regulated domain-containing protein n=1 Tax=Ectopseudomonas mendocina TaxID=300 RepID=A0ABZ2RLX4_ECTME